MRLSTRIANVDIEQRERIEGKSKYTIRKLLMLWLNSFTSFTIVPLRVASFIGGVCSGIGFLSGLFVVIRKLVSPAIAAGYSSIVALLLFIGGIIMLILGLIGEYIGRIFMTVSNAPQYAIRKTINTEPNDANHGK